jgi:hypothetical protein
MSVLERIERRIENMSTMLTRFGIDTSTFTQLGKGAVFTTSMRACQSCDNGSICTAWLTQADRKIKRVPEFCPNAQRFVQAKAMLSFQGSSGSACLRLN